MTQLTAGKAGTARRLLALVVVAALMAGCAAGRAFGRGDSAARAGDWDTAVEQYRQAVQRNPGRTDYQIALERAMRTASILHLDQARVLEVRMQLEDALREYRRASEFDPTNRQIAAKAIEIERGSAIRSRHRVPRPRSSSCSRRRASRRSRCSILRRATRSTWSSPTPA